MLAFDHLTGQRTRKNRNYVWERIGAQVLQVPYREKELMMTLILCDLQQPTDVI